MNLSHIIYVAGHASFKSSYGLDDIPSNPFEVQHNSLWALPEHRQGETPYYGEHVLAGIELAKKAPHSLLILSAGFNSPLYYGDKYDWSEAYSYLIAAERSGWIEILSSEVIDYQDSQASFPIPIVRAVTKDGHELTITLNEYARDSLEELLGGLALFEALSQQETYISFTTVGWEFKKDRFIDHAAALEIPSTKFSYVGVNNPSSEHLAAALKGEAATRNAFMQDKLGNAVGGVLMAKRLERDPLHRGNPHWDALSTKSVM